MEARWYFDVVSPFAYLHLQAMRTLRTRCSITPVPILFGAVLSHLGQLGPAEIPGKRTFTYRFVQWRAEQAGIALRFPPAHPFNPIAALRLIIAAGGGWDAVEAVFDHCWRDGGLADAPSLAPVARTLGIDDVAAATARDEVKSTLRANTEGAIADGVFGVPTLAFGTTHFWGDDASALAEAWLRDPGMFERAPYAGLATWPVGVERVRPRTA